MMRCDYLPNDYEARLNGGIALYNGEPVILNASARGIYICTFPDGQNIKQVEPDDPSLDIAAFQLGYVNVDRNCYYVYRKPARRYKQTLTHNVLDYFDPVGAANGLSKIDTHGIFYSTHFKKMLANDYPRLDVTLKNLQATVSKVRSRAISRDLALAIDSFGIIRVYYKMEEVGYINPGSTVVQVPGGVLAWVVSKYLKEYSWEVV